MKLGIRTNIGQFLQGVYILVTLLTLDLAQAQNMSRIDRAPANFVPDDDLIEVPVVIEKNFMDKVHDENRSHMENARKEVQNWQIQTELATAYGLDKSGIYNIPDQNQAMNFVQRNYLRFVSQRVERNSNEGLQNLWQQWTTDDEIDSIKEYENHEKYIIKAQKERGGNNKLQATKEVKVGKEQFKLDFQPRLEMGMVKIQLRSGLFNMKAWVGVNGNQEVQLTRRIKMTKTDLSARYYVDQGRALAAVDQRISDSWSLRLTHDKAVESFGSISETGLSENNIIQLRFQIGF